MPVKEVTPECDSEGICTEGCDAPSVTCVVGTLEIGCEIKQFRGMSATVGCGRTASVGTANCGACGSVAVEVYFDGKQCWEGIPSCSRPEYFGKFLDPHAPQR